MPVVALAGYALYVALAFGLRALLHYRATGTTGYVGLSGRPGSAEWCAGVLFGVAAIGAGLAPAAQLVGLVRPWSIVAPAADALVGVACATIGIVGTFAAQLAMGRSWRIGIDRATPTDLIARGPFRVVRNPIFTWMTVTSVGLALVAPNLLALASVVTLLIALEIQVRAVEEPYLLRTHGERYRRYAAATGRFVPGVGRLE